MPKTQPDAAFTAALQRFVAEKHKGKNAPAGQELGVPRQHMKALVHGAIPMEPRKGKCLAVLKRAGYYAASTANGVSDGVTLGANNVTVWADMAGLANMLRFLADLVEKQHAAEILALPRDGEIMR